MSLQKAAQLTFKIMGLKKDESLLIVADKNKMHMAEVLFEEGKKITKNAKLIEIPVGKVSGEPPPKEVEDEMKRYDVEVLITTTSLTHTKARRDASSKDVRIATMPNITKEIFIRFSKADVKTIYNLGENIRKFFNSSGKVRLVTDKGTDINFNIRTEQIPQILNNDADFLDKKGDFGNIPLGEVSCRPLEKTANGKFVIDVSVLGELVDKPIEVFVEDGIAINIKGGKTAEKLKNELNKVGKDAFILAELGIGTNGSAKITGNTLEDEKVLGTCHIAFGNNLSYGGTNDVPVHLDAIIGKPTIFFDDKKIMEKGKFLI